MKSRNNKIIYLTQSALIAAVYTAATYISAMVGAAYGAVQFRFSEALTILPVFTPAAIPGLAVGCILSNIASPYGIIDMALGAAATLLAAIASRGLRNIRFKGLPILSALPPVLFNAAIIGAEISFSVNSENTLKAYLVNFALIAAGQAVVCLGLGLPMYVLINRSPIKKIFSMSYDR